MRIGIEMVQLAFVVQALRMKLAIKTNKYYTLFSDGTGHDFPQCIKKTHEQTYCSKRIFKGPYTCPFVWITKKCTSLRVVESVVLLKYAYIMYESKPTNYC
jgi:hypothetical protein